MADTNMINQWIYYSTLFNKKPFKRNPVYQFRVFLYSDSTYWYLFIIPVFSITSVQCQAISWRELNFNQGKKWWLRRNYIWFVWIDLLSYYNISKILEQLYHHLCIHINFRWKTPMITIISRLIPKQTNKYIKAENLLLIDWPYRLLHILNDNKFFWIN